MVSEQKTKFKDTEIGMIPEDLEEHTFGDFIDVLSGFAFKSSDLFIHSSPELSDDLA